MAAHELAATEGIDTVAELLRARADARPERVGYTFLADGDGQETDLTYGQAHVRALAVATRLREAGAVRGDRVVLLMPPGLDYVTAFFGCLYAGVIAVPMYPPEVFQLDRSVPRLAAVVADADPVAALTISPLLGFLDELTSRAPRLADLRWLSADDVPTASTVDGLEPADADTIAMLQYTSGSTAAPKGVLVSHGNLLHNSARIKELFGTTPHSRGVSWLPPYHDMGLIGGLIQPLYAGAWTALLSPLHFLEQPVRWLRAIDRYRVTTSGGPNFAYDLCARKADPAELAGWDLSCWEVAFNGAEPIRPATLHRFADALAPAGFRARAFLRCYGLAEATLIVSGVGGLSGGGSAENDPAPAAVPVDRDALARGVAEPGTEESATELMSCGASLPDQHIAIVDPVTRKRCVDGHVGEIWVSGPSVAHGYWRRPDTTERTFRARIDGGEPPFLRTGDLGFLRDGELVVTGRLKDLIIIRGRNHYPQDLELTAERVEPALRPGCSAAFVVEDGGEESLVLVHELRKQATETDPLAAAARIRQAVAEEHGLRARTVLLLRSGGMPKTSSGKVQRGLCRTRFLADDLPVLARSDPEAGGTATTATQVLAASGESRAALLEDYLRAQVAAVSGVGELDREQPLTVAGIDSLAVLQLRQQIETELGARLPLRHLLTGASLRELVGELDRELDSSEPAQPADPTSPTNPASPASPVDTANTEPGACPLSVGQRWIWLSQQFEPDSSAYNISVALRSLDPVDGTALRRALDAVAARHPALRATFGVREGEPVMLVRPEGGIELREYDAGTLTDEALACRLVSAARRPFALESGPLVRVGVHRRVEDTVLLLSAHHIVTDFWSMTVLADDIGKHYAAYAQGHEITLPKQRATYADFVAHQRELLTDDVESARLARYWDEQVGDGVPPLTLPGTEAGAPAGARSFSLPEALTARLRRRAESERVTLFVVLLTAFEALLHGETNATDLAVGTSVTGRTRPEFADVVGCCMNPVLIRSRAEGTVRELLTATRDRVAGALEHQDYPMALLASRHRAPGRGGSLFDALFTFNRAPAPRGDLAAVAAIGAPNIQRSLGPLRIENFPLPQAESALAVELVMSETGGRLHGLLRHRAGSLTEAAAASLLERFETILVAVAADPGVAVAELLPKHPTKAETGTAG